MTSQNEQIERSAGPKATAIYSSYPILAVAMLAVALDPPFTGWIDFAVWLAALLGLVLGGWHESFRRWAWAFAAMLAALVIRLVFPVAEIHEGHNVFVGGAPNSVFASKLPPRVYEYLEANAVLRFKPHQVSPDDKLFAFSADAALGRPRYSRTVADIGFADRYQLRLGAFNNHRYNLYRADQPPRTDLPYFVFYEMGPEFAGSQLCWQGSLFIENASRAFERVFADGRQCRTLTPLSDGGSMPRIFGVEPDPKRPLAMSLSPPLGVAFPLWLNRGGSVAAAVTILLLIIRWRRMRGLRFWCAASGVTVTLITALIYLPDFRSGFFLYEGGNDGLTYVSFARAMLAALNGGDWSGFLRGGVDIFYFMPGQRYFQAVQMLLFGETLFGYLIIGCFLPLVILRLMQIILPEKYIVPLFVCFLIIPIFEAFGFLQFYYVKLLLRGFGEPLAYMLFFGALCLALPYFQGRRVLARTLFLSASFLSLAVIIRPNLGPGAAALLLALSWPLIRERNSTAFVGLCLGFAPVLLLPAHNIWFGGEFVLLTKASDIPVNMMATPSDYLSAVSDIATLSFPSAAIQKVGRHWWGVVKPYEFWYILALAAVFWAAFAKWTETPVRVLAWVVIAQYGVFLFFVAGGRYGHLTWTLSLLVFFAVLHSRIVPGWSAWRRGNYGGSY